jgi:hypothetical protein
MAGEKGLLRVTGQCTKPRGFKRVERCLLSAQIREKKEMTAILFEAWLLNHDEGMRAQKTTSSLSC